MRKYFNSISFLSFLLIASLSFGQDISSKIAPGLYLGLNSGGVWQTSDVNRKLGVGLGAHLEAYLTKNSNNLLGYSLRASYLYTNHTGQDKTFTSDFSENPLVNGNFGADYNPQNLALYNYQTKTQDLSLQFLIHANQLRQKGIIFYGMGGLGATGYNVSSDLKNGQGNVYNYTSTLGAQEAQNIQDGVYETQIKSEWVFTPTLGVGLGYQFTDNLTAGIEYRTLFSQTNELDATRFKGNTLTTNLDKYHYLSLNLGLKIGQFNNTQRTKQKGSNSSGRLPVIEGRGTGTSTSYLYNCEAKLPLKIFYVENESNINVFINGEQVKDIYYSYRKNKFDLRYSLSSDTVTIKVVANNNVGSDSFQKRFICNYTQQQIIKNSPTIKLTSPSKNTITTYNCNQDISFQTTNISSLEQVTLLDNGNTIPNTDYSYNAGIIKINRQIINNSRLTAIVKNETGTASAYVSITCNTAPPSVSLLSPLSHNVNDFNVKATFKLSNVGPDDRITVFENDVPLSNSYFTINYNKDRVKITKTINTDGIYNYTVKVNSNRGDASDFITYNAVTPKDPKVWFSNNTTSFQRCFQNFTLYTKNVDNKSQINITVNSFRFKRYTFDPLTGKISFNHLIPANSIIIVEVLNDYGVQTVTRTVACGSYNTGGTTTTTGGPTTPSGNTTKTAQPEISLESISNVNVTCGNTINIVASILFINSKSDIRVLKNGTPVFSTKYNYNSSTKRFNMPFNVNARGTIEIKATNASGTDSKSVSFNCSSLTSVDLPTISVTSTTVNPATCEATIKAQVTNVTYKSGIEVSLNGQVVSPAFYTYTNGLVTLRKTISNGSKVVISAKNKSGKATADKNVQCRKPPKVAPSIFEVSRSTGNCLIAGEYKIQNILPSELTVTSNGIDYPYTLQNSTLKLQTGKINTNTTVKIMAITSTGTTEKIAHFNCTITPPALPPTVSILQQTNVVNQTNCTATITAKTTGVTLSSEIEVTQNNKPIPFSFTGDTVTINSSGIETNTKLEITVTNPAGSAKDNITLNCAPAPSVRHISSFVNNCLLNATFKTEYATKEQVKVLIDGKTVPFDFNNNRVKITSHPISGSTELKVIVTNSSGTAETKKTFSCVSTVDFDIKNGTVIPNKKYKAEITVIGCALKAGGNGADYPVQVQVFLNGVAQNPFGNYNGREAASNVNIGSQQKWLSANVPANTPISIKAKSFNPRNNSTTPAYEQSSEGSTKMVIVLKNGDKVPNITGFQGQDAAEAYLKPYIENGKMKLKDNQAIYLFELGTDRTDVQWYDLQDCVVLVSLAQAE